VIRQVLALFACAIALAACRVDIAVDVVVEADGSGRISVVTTADAEVIEVVPTIAEELAVDDIVAADWELDGPTPTADGGLTLTISHDFVSAEEATNLLNSLGPPFNQMTIQRTTNGDETTTQLSGLLGLSNGFETFADEDLITAVGSLPFAEEIAASGATPESSMSAVIRVELPGVIDPERTNGSQTDDGRLEWVVPLNGDITEWRAVSVQAPGDDRWWARPLSIVALIGLVAWVGFHRVRCRGEVSTGTELQTPSATIRATSTRTTDVRFDCSPRMNPGDSRVHAAGHAGSRSSPAGNAPKGASPALTNILLAAFESRPAT